MPEARKKCDRDNCDTIATQRCASCLAAWYCSKEHQKETWSKHKHFCHEPYQMGLFASGQSQTVTPVFIPISTGRIDTLPRNKLARMISCNPNELELTIAPMSTLFEPSYHIVCAYNAGPNGLLRPRDPRVSIAWSSAPGELCSHAVHMTRSLTTSFGSQINGSVLFFYLQKGRDFLEKPDFSATQEVIKAWNETDGDCSDAALRSLAVVFKRNMTKPETCRADRIDHFDAVVFPALERKPFITKLPFQYIPAEDPVDNPFHYIDKIYVLGDMLLEMRYVGETQLVVLMRDTFLVDGSPINQSIQAASKGRAKHTWAGNIVVVKNCPGSELGMDVDSDAVGTALEFLTSYGR